MLASSSGLFAGAVHSKTPLAAEILTALGGQLRPNQLAAEFTERIVALASTNDVLNELIEVGNLQEVIWQLQEAGKITQATQLEEMVAWTLATEKIISIKQISQGSSGARLVEFANGVRGVYKVVRPAHEVAMYHLDKLIGTNVFPVTVMREIDGKQGSMQLVIENAISAAEIKQIRRARGDEPHLHNSPAINTLRLLGHDIDCNAYNCLFPIKGRAIAIDGGHAFLKGKNWIGLWERFRKYLNQKLSEREDQLDSIKIHEDYRIDPAFIASLETITAEQVDAVIAMVVSLDSDTDLQKIFDKLMQLASVLGSVEGSMGLSLYNSLSRSEFAELAHLRRQSINDKDVQQKFMHISKYTRYHDAVALGGLHRRISQYAALVRGDDSYMTDMLTPTEIMRTLQRETDTQPNNTKPLLWRIVAADGSEHRLLTGSGDATLSIFSEPSLAIITEEIMRASKFIHSNRNEKDDYLAYATAIIKSELGYLFNSLPMKKQLLVWAKAGNKKIISAPYSYVSTRPRMNTTDQLEYELNLRLAYTYSDLTELENLAKLDFNLDLHARSEALLAKLKQHCVLGERCLVFADIVEVLSSSADHSNLLDKLSATGFIIERLE